MTLNLLRESCMRFFSQEVYKIKAILLVSTCVCWSLCLSYGTM